MVPELRERYRELKQRLEPSLDLFADVILNPAFPEADFERLRKIRLASIQRERVTPYEAVSRVATLRGQQWGEVRLTPGRIEE